MKGYREEEGLGGLIETEDMWDSLMYLPFCRLIKNEMNFTLLKIV